MQVYDHTNPKYIKVWGRLGEDRFNGAYYYSREIVRNIIPKIKTDRKWFTVNCTTEPADHSIVFIHDNKFPAKTYSWIEQYNDVILVCGVPETMEKVAHLGTPIYLPLSIDVKEVEQYKQPKTRDCAYAGRWSKIQKNATSYQHAHLCGLDRRTLLMEMAKYRKVYAVGRTAIEARALGCEIGAYDPRYNNVSIWKILDNSDAAVLLQKALIDVEREGATTIDCTKYKEYDSMILKYEDS